MTHEKLFEALFSEPNRFRHEQVRAWLIDRAKALHLDNWKTLYQAYQSGAVQDAKREQRALANANGKINLIPDHNGGVAKVYENFMRILQKDPALRDSMRFNELTGMPERVDRDGTMHAWTDTDTSELRIYIEKQYHLRQNELLTDALEIMFKHRRYHPVRNYISTLKWDGKPRIGTLFVKYLGAEDSPYIRECERLMFSGGIHRAFCPGCKFDCVVVLQGNQGGGKTTFIRFLAMNDDWYREVTEIEGQKGIEALRGAWFVELGELLALKRTKDVEAVKSFITRQVDTYRQPFHKYVDTFPRQCVFMGTTNNAQFLTDKTGNRRWFPVKVNSSGRELYEKEQEIREYIKQCWAEAYAMYQSNNLPPVESMELLEEIKARQEEAVEDDYRVGMIEDYLSDPERDRVCVRELWRDALNELGNPSKRDSNEITQIMSSVPGWERYQSSRRFGEHGMQRGWFRIQETDAEVLF